MRPGQDNTELKRTDMALKALWNNWMMAVGALTLPLFVAIFVPRLWVPFACLIAGYLITSVKRRSESTGACSMLMNMTDKALYLSALFMFMVVILCTDWLVPTVIHLELYNTELPFITCLVEFPVVIILSVMTLYFGLESRTCRECQRRNGYYAGDSIVATLYYRESKYQIWLLLVLSVMLGAVQYWYYFARYINYNRNSPDLFFFNIMPLSIYVISLVIMAGRYRGMHEMYATFEASNPGGAGSTLVRFLTLCGDELLLRQGDDGRWDTPAIEVIGRTPAIGETQARVSFQALSGVKQFSLRYCYTNEGFARGTNVIHYAAFIPADEKNCFAPENQWFNVHMLDRALASNTLSPYLANELYRIHTMTMAWKTYDRDGRRRYPVKHYRPTFRLSDLESWKVDYDDMLWFEVAHSNEDRRFFHLNRLWSRITGVFRRQTSA